jgi:protein tyrosine/serine phosphatase
MDRLMPARQPGSADAKTGDRANRSRPTRWLIRSLKIVGITVGLTVASIGSYWGVLQYQGNLHAVTAGVLYRSAQLSKTEFAAAVGEYGIKSVLNLRGAHAGEAWYDGEMAAAGDLSLAHYDYPLSAKRFVTAQQINEILAIVRRAPKPLLIHCKSGADRAGLVAALYRFAETGASAADADRELTLVYGHFPYLTSRSVAMDNSFWAFVHATPREAAR